MLAVGGLLHGNPLPPGEKFSHSELILWGRIPWRSRACVQRRCGMRTILTQAMHATGPRQPNEDAGPTLGSPQRLATSGPRLRTAACSSLTDEPRAYWGVRWRRGVIS